MKITNFNCWLTGKGSAELYVSGDGFKLQFDFLGFNNPLDDLINGLLRIVHNQSQFEETLFMEELEGWQIHLVRNTGGRCYVEIRYSTGFGFYTKDSEGVVGDYNIVYTGVNSIRELSAIVCLGIRDLQLRHTDQEYSELWGGLAFPTSKLVQLESGILNL